MKTLWDFIETVAAAFRPAPTPDTAAPRSRARARPAKPPSAAKPHPVRIEHAPALRPRTNRPTAAAPAQPLSAEARYEQITRQLLDEHRIRVRKWRTSMTGVAWELAYRDGTRARLIECPKPKGPMSAAVFLHEVGHHAIGFNRYKPRCLEEYHAWAWALAAMHRLGLNISDGVQHRVHESLWYALSKARRRGMRGVPAELLPFADRPQRGTPSAPMQAWLARLDTTPALERAQAQH